MVAVVIGGVTTGAASLVGTVANGVTTSLVGTAASGVTASSAASSVAAAGAAAGKAASLVLTLPFANFVLGASVADNGYSYDCFTKAFGESEKHKYPRGMPMEAVLSHPNFAEFAVSDDKHYLTTKDGRSFELFCSYDTNGDFLGLHI
ncbi:hypothetical protein HDU79_011356 [Rhizoclosmatium sp. JEL0117]|nr:hypothetical protein HDU79_011356 [Rhizoclosmatium sp. JEL0117]